MQTFAVVAPISNVMMSEVMLLYLKTHASKGPHISAYIEGLVLNRFQRPPHPVDIRQISIRSCLLNRVSNGWGGPLRG